MPQIIASSTAAQWQPVALSDSEKQEIDKEAQCYPSRQAVCIEALKIVQEHRGWVSDEAVDAVAGYLSMSPAEVDSVATFYNLIFREPVGENVILLCNSVSCWIMGCEKLQQALKDKLNIGFGQTTEDGKFTLLPVPCLGDCDRAPAMMINKQQYGNVDTDHLDTIVNGSTFTDE